jgi:ATP-dependent Clp protease adaptor protein ClpS
MTEKDISRESPIFSEQNEIIGKGENFLILHNDDIHTFIIHYKGKCDVKKGSFDYLKPMKDGLIDRGLDATID